MPEHASGTFFDHAADTPKVYDLPAGCLAVFSTRSPAKETANEDAAGFISLPDGTLALILADGAGGYAGGEHAAQTAVNEVLGALQAVDDLPVRAAIVNGFERAHQRVLHDQGGATTLVVAEINDQTLRLYHAGDSAACVVGGRGRLKSQTVPHSPTGYAVESGLLDAADALHHEQRHLVSNLIGIEPMSIEVGTPQTLAPRDTVLLASDGLYDNLYADEITRLAPGGSAADACQRLSEAAQTRMRRSDPKLPGKPDDLTILVYRRRAGTRRSQAPG